MKHLLDFEKPYIDLQRRLEELREQPEETDVPLDIGDEIRQLEEKIEAKKRELYSNLSAWQRVQLARHPQRPYSLDYINKTFSGLAGVGGRAGGAGPNGAGGLPWGRWPTMAVWGRSIIRTPASSSAMDLGLRWTCSRYGM